jgi:histidinol phosphatase-like enzyme (inositol monophosphatase family)
MDLDDLMEFATRIAVRAGEITLDHFGRAAVERKGDGSEVTAADRASEEYLRLAIGEAHPEDSIVGEEGARAEGRSGRRWIVDPVDATRSFAAGVPLYGVLLALEVDGAPVLGCCHLPALGETLVAATGAGAWIGGRPARVSEVDRLEEARVVTSGLEYWRDWATDEGRAGWDRLVARSRFARTWGDCYGYLLVATGRAEVLADPASGALWDYSPMLPILHEAGGRFTTLGGGPVSEWTTALASNGRLHDHAAACWDAAARGDAAVQVPSILQRHAAGG